MREEELIKQKFGKTNHFQVPEGYFEQLTSQIMSQIPTETDHKQQASTSFRLWHNIRLTVGIAAVGVGVIIGISTLLNTPQNHSTTGWTMSQNMQQSYEEMNAALDYAMVDDNEIYQYLTSCDAE